MPKVVTKEELEEREQVILDAACRLIGQCGFAGLTMDKVVAEVPYSKGSVYKQFGSAEELLLAITNQGASHLLALMQKAEMHFELSRERYLARTFAFFLYSQLYPTHFFCEIEALTPSVREKASAERLSRGVDLLNAFTRLSLRFVQAGIDTGDLVLKDDSSPIQLANSSWSAEFGVCAYAMAAHRNNQQLPGELRDSLEQQLYWLVNTLLDGLNWQPLSSQFDYRGTWHACKQTLFAEEVALMN